MSRSLQHEKYQAIAKTPGVLESQNLIQQLAHDKDLLHDHLFALTTAENPQGKHRPRIHYLQMLKAELDRHRTDKEKLQAELLKRDALVRSMQQQLESAQIEMGGEERRQLFQTPLPARTAEMTATTEPAMSIAKTARRSVVQSVKNIQHIPKQRKSIAQAASTIPVPPSERTEKRKSVSVHEKENSLIQVRTNVDFQMI